MDWRPDVIVLGPGGIKGFQELGALFILSERKLLDRVHSYAGVSVGSIIALLLVCGYNIREIISNAADTDLFSGMMLPNIKDVYKQIGVISNAVIKKKISNLVSNKLGYVPSLKQLYMITGLNFMTVTTNLTKKGKAEYLSYITYPEMSCIDAVMLSINIPFLFFKLEYQNNIYIDGAFSNPYPVDIFDDGKTNILALYIEDNYDETNYLMKVLSASNRNLRVKNIRQSSSKVRHLELVSRVIDTTGFTVSIQDKANMVIDGYKAGENFLRILQKPLSLVRNSKYSIEAA